MLITIGINGTPEQIADLAKALQDRLSADSLGKIDRALGESVSKEDINSHRQALK